MRRALFVTGIVVCGCGSTTAPLPPVTLASGQYALGIVVDSTNVYWFNSPAIGGPFTGAVMGVALDGGTPVVVAAVENPSGIAIDSTSIYWTDPISVSGNGMPGTIGTGTVRKVPLPGGTPVTLASSQVGGAIAVDSTSVYFSDGGGVVKVGLSGGAPESLVSGLLNVGGLSVDSSSVYWVSVEGAVTKVAVTGGTTVLLTSKRSNAIAVDATSVYFADALDGAIWKVGLAGSTLSPITEGRGYTNGIAVDATSVYWTVQGALGTHGCNADVACGGFVMKVGLFGGTPVTLASSPNPFALAVDSTSVYWTDTTEGTVMKAPK
jgi:hypothetical protein